MPPHLLGSEGQFCVADEHMVGTSQPGSNPSSPCRVDTGSPEPQSPHLQNGLTTVPASRAFSKDEKVDILCVPLFHSLPTSKITGERDNVV